MRCRYRFDLWAWEVEKGSISETGACPLSAEPGPVVPEDRLADWEGLLVSHEFGEPVPVSGTEGGVHPEDAAKEFLCDFTAIRIEAEFCAASLAQLRLEISNYKMPKPRVDWDRLMMDREKFGPAGGLTVPLKL